MPPTAPADPFTQATTEVARLTGTLTALGLHLRPEDDWLAEELAMVAEAMTALLRVARWSPGACTAALGGPITIRRDQSGPITTDAVGTRYPVLGLYDTTQRLLTVNDWSFDARTGGEANGRRVFLHELAHAWDHRTAHLLSRVIGWLPGPRASGYAHSSRFEDWAEAVMGAVYGAAPGHEAFDRIAAGGPSWRLRYVRWAFARYQWRGDTRAV